MAAVACEHVKKCTMQVDECRATASYDNPAQSIYSTYSSKQQTNHTMVLQQGIQHWFLQHKQVKSDIIDSYEDRYVNISFVWFIVVDKILFSFFPYLFYVY